MSEMDWDILVEKISIENDEALSQGNVTLRILKCYYIM